MVAILLITSPVTISLFPTSIDLDPIFKEDRDLDRFRFSYRAGHFYIWTLAVLGKNIWGLAPHHLGGNNG